MKFGFFHNIHDVTKQRDYSALLDELRELAIMCDRAGFETFWMPEHHFSVWGRELLPNPLLVAADLAARTERIRIGLGAAIITFWHPLRAAEDIALLDHLTGGRLEVGAGRGNYGLEAKNLNPIADPNNPAMNVKVFDEAVSVLKAALGQERFAFKGDIYQFPAPDFRADRAHSVDDPAYVDPQSKELVKLSTFPRPRQKPLPPMWQMVNSLDSIRHAARQDMGIVMWRPDRGIAGAVGCVSRRRCRAYRTQSSHRRANGDHARYLRRAIRAGGARHCRGTADGIPQLFQLARPRHLPRSR
jgi:alkanesulfonate monooxygenase SsuD/methylene tetrahydromethanopterin reductase-like flavin-dependent oxidoreductase (luciferase family)